MFLKLDILSRSGLETITDSVPYNFRKIDLFATIDEDEKLVPYCTVEKLKPGDKIVKKKDLQSTFMVLVRGVLFRSRGDMSDIVEQDFWGGEEGQYDYDVIAKTPSLVLKISPEVKT